jgi:hypothetical protein
VTGFFNGLVKPGMNSAGSEHQSMLAATIVIGSVNAVMVARVGSLGGLKLNMISWGIFDCQNAVFFLLNL